MPLVVGVKVTLIEQVVPGVKEPLVLPAGMQVLVCAKSPLAARDEMVSVALPVFLTITVFAGLVVPTACKAKVSDPGVRLTTDPTPVPDKATVCGLDPPLSLTLRVDAMFPGPRGVKVTLIVQFVPAGTVPLVLPAGMQVLVWANGRAEVEMPVTSSGLEPLLARVTGTGALLVPRFWLPKATLVGDKLTAVPVPVRLIVCGLPTELSVTVNVPGSAPTTWGVNVTETEQLAETARLDVQVVEATL